MPVRDFGLTNFSPCFAATLVLRLCLRLRASLRADLRNRPFDWPGGYERIYAQFASQDAVFRG